MPEGQQSQLLPSAARRQATQWASWGWGWGHSERGTLLAVGRGEVWSMAEASDNGGSVPARVGVPSPTLLLPLTSLPRAPPPHPHQ